MEGNTLQQINFAISYWMQSLVIEVNSEKRKHRNYNKDNPS